MPFDIDDVGNVIEPYPVRQKKQLLTLIALNEKIAEALELAQDENIDSKALIVDADLLGSCNRG